MSFWIYNSKGQTDSTDLNFYNSTAVAESANDSLYLMNSDLVELQVEFQLEDESFTLGKICVELILLPPSSPPSLLSHNSYTPMQLQEQFMISEDTVSISFGWYPTQME
jgi:hypothetical protein